MMQLRIVLILLSLVVVVRSSKMRKPSQAPESVRGKRSVSCSLGGQRGCKWTCRMRGYIYGECKEGESGTECNCRKPVSRKALMEYITAKLSKNYPDVHLVAKIIEEFFESQNKSYDDKKWDGKWRPLPLLIGVLYKVQERQESLASKTGTILPSDNQEVVPLLGYYWHMIMAADSNIRPGTTTVEQDKVKEVVEQNKLKYAASLDISPEDVAWVWTAEMDRNRTSMSTYIPDHIVTVDHAQKCIVLTILGTRVFPAPQPLDIIMDLVATTQPFLGGQAHAGMVWGTRNLVSTAIPKVTSELTKHPGYSLLVIGYSLGAGLAQLLTMELELGQARDLLPPDVAVRTIGYGSPPVFTSNNTIPVLPNIFLVQNNNDGISGASLRNVNDVFLKTSAIDKLNYKRRDLLKMLLSDVDPDESDDYVEKSNIALSEADLPTSEEGIQWIEFNEFQTEDQKSNYQEIIEDDENEDDTFHVEDHVWQEVESVVTIIPESKEPRLHHVGQTFLVITRKDEHSGVEVKNYQGLNQTDLFSQQLVFSPSMFDDHMPGGYDFIFNGIGSLNTTLRVELEVLEGLFKTNNQRGFRKKLKRKWRIFKTNTKEFFKGLG